MGARAMAASECFISVDVETSGPIPGDYSMLAIGACLVGGGDDGFYAELKPISDHSLPAALKVSGFKLDELAVSGERPEDALMRLRDWVERACGGARPVFVGFNAGFDWSFVNWYFIHFLGENPFGFAPLDVKAYYMGLVGCSWDDTRSSRIRSEFQPAEAGDHNALTDARVQAEMFRKMLAVERPWAR
jgi:DNA polymerase III epsilon subunit-like protein